MKKVIKAIGVASTLMGLTMGAHVAQADTLGISVGVSGEVAPGVYGTVHVTNRTPRVVISSPVVVERRAYYGRPVYLAVPPGQAKHWGRFCHRYNACARPVYFVRSPEYRDFRPDYIESRYVVRSVRYERDEPRWRGHDDDDDWGHGRGHGWGHGHGHDRD